jgi:hypothetical protein
MVLLCGSLCCVEAGLRKKKIRKKTKKRGKKKLIKIQNPVFMYLSDGASARLKRKANEAVLIKETFLNRMSHELRTVKKKQNNKMNCFDVVFFSLLQRLWV